MMKISIEISLYPLAESKYKDEIWAFIETLNGTEGIEVRTNGMSTQVFGEYDFTLHHVTQQMKAVHEKLNTAVFVLKIMGCDRSHR